MFHYLARMYYVLTLQYPLVVFALVLALLAGALHQMQHFRLDASSDSLVLENDADLLYDREIRARYGSDEFLVVTWTPQADLFSDQSLEALAGMREEIVAMDRVASVTSMLDVPLLDSPRQSFADLEAGIRTLLDDDVDRAMAREELLTSPLYRDLLINRDASTTAMLVTLARDEEAYELLDRRDELRLRRAEEGLTVDEAAELERVSAAYDRRNAELQAELEQGIEQVRTILDGYRDRADIHLGGVPMIAADMIAFVRNDIRTFGIGVGLFILVLLAVAFRRVRWVVVPAMICGGVVVGMIGFLGFMSWPVTVVSSNFISLVLILTLSLIVHLIVRHRELEYLDPAADGSTLLRGTVDSKFKPSFYTAVTTVIAFASLMFADIRPVMDFGLMMVCAVIFGFVFTFVLFPSTLVRLPTGKTPVPTRDLTERINLSFAGLVGRTPTSVWVVFVAIALLAVAGMSRLHVENRFIDYFKSDTEIHQGMVLIDQELGGTTPLDIVLDAPAGFMNDDDSGEQSDDAFADDGYGDDGYGDDGYGDDEFADDDWADDFELDEEPEGATAGYWFNEYGLAEIGEFHEWLEQFPETGKILSLSTTSALVTHLNDGQPLDTFELAVMHRRLPDALRSILIEPYMSDDGNQVRIATRVIDSDPDLQRDELIREIKQGLISEFDLAPEQVNLTGMLVLYNNVMQSLFRSQFFTLGIVFFAIMLMFGFLFRSVRMSVIGPMPTLVAACAVLGVMGWLGIPLDIMTITIAAITIGIGVHDTIHYTDRFQQEMREHGDYPLAIRNSHRSVGRAMFYTTVIVVLGFSILTLSNFIPTIYFGLFTGVAMVFALLSNLTLLPLMLWKLRAFNGSTLSKTA